MSYTLTNNRGNLFPNKNKERESSPDYTGEILVDGKAYFIDGWIKDGSRSKFMSLRVKLKDKQPDNIDLDEIGF